MKFTIRGSLPTMNEIIQASKTHWTQYRKLKEDYTNLVAWSIKDKRPLKNKVHLLVVWYCKDRRVDPDNIASGGQKILLDGLVKAGVLKDDGWKYVGEIRHIFRIDRKNPRIQVLLSEMDS